MALIVKNKISKVNKTRNTVHQETEATYTFFKKEGKSLFQIDTYGTQTRKMTDKISQSIQFDKETAKYLVELLTKEFMF